ncbi:uncharacterized protein APUU_11617A [Aspergillus puulaauensis]|uniref:Uncharacterized protein n=1 Tax=Aspergillus puulaauensis TaxID=1220207 RepID=A0A7R8AGM5_9EURO|nr:uncharacterized protein APUU_11617A [Aspergillus puulaauensis]BCS18789.1 hypothetical protein APUU_11617A [Aspergillus puulaauensis]
MVVGSDLACTDDGHTFKAESFRQDLLLSTTCFPRSPSLNCPQTSTVLHFGRHRTLEQGISLSAILDENRNRVRIKVFASISLASCFAAIAFSLRSSRALWRRIATAIRPPTL